LGDLHSLLPVCAARDVIAYIVGMCMDVRVEN
jgi:hypothetical protein